jgi:cobalt-zinc-cadmium efflux system outer membrane protein
MRARFETRGEIVTVNAIGAAVSAAALAAALVGATAVHAAERPVTFAEAVAAADRNPRVLAGRRAARALEDARQASPVLDANPMVAVVGGPRVAPGSERGLEGAIGFSQSLSLEGAAGHRRDALGGEAAWLAADTDADLLARRLAGAIAWLGVWEAEQQVSAAAKDVVNEEALVRLVARLAAAGERTQADLATVEARLVEAQLRERTAEGTLVEARAELGAELRAVDGEVLVTEGPPPEVPAPPRAEQDRVLRAAGALPAVYARALLARSELLRAREERATRGARLTIGAELRHDALGASVVEGTLAIPIPLFAVGAREYASRAANSLRMDGDAADAQIRAQAALVLAFHEIEHTDEVFTLLATRLVPAAERATTLRERQLELGDGTLLDVIDARRTVLDARVRLVRATRDRAWARIHVRVLAAATNGAP